MIAVLGSPFFLLFCATTAAGTYLAHRLSVQQLPPTRTDRLLAVAAAVLSIALSITAYYIRIGAFRSSTVHPTIASVVAALTGLGIAYVCIKCILPPEDEASNSDDGW